MPSEEELHDDAGRDDAGAPEQDCESRCATFVLEVLDAPSGKDLDDVCHSRCADGGPLDFVLFRRSTTWHTDEEAGA